MTAVELLADYRARARTPSEVVQSLAQRIERLDPRLGAFVATDFERALVQATEADRRWSTGTARPLEGVPLAVKDLIDSADLPTAYGSPIFRGHQPARDALIVERLRDAGAILLGKTATHEFAWGITTESDPERPARNPWAPDRIPGGSSGGSGIAVAAGFAPLAIGTDTAGSIRVPAAFCGIAGLRPTVGSVPTDGVFGLAPSFDVPGPLARTPADLALCQAVLADRPADAALRPLALSGLRVGIAVQLQPPAPASFAAALDTTVATLQAAGATVIRIDLPGVENSFEVLGTIQRVEALAQHRSRGIWPNRAKDYGDDVRGRLEEAERISDDEYRQALAARDRIRATLDAALSRVDALLGLASSAPPLPIGEDAPDFRRQVLACTMPQSLVGLPAVALRAGFDDDGLPIGVQLTGARDAEQPLLALAAALFERTAELQQRWPLD